MALKIQAGRQVQLAYRLTDLEGRLLEERTPENIYEYIQGQGQILPALENILNGRTAGYTAEMQLTAREAYGDYDQDLVAEVPRSQLPVAVGLEVGMKFNTAGPDGRSMVVRLISLDDDMVTLDGNHPLAGMDIIFEVRVLGVVDLAAGHVESELEDSTQASEVETGNAEHSSAPNYDTNNYEPSDYEAAKKKGSLH